MLRTPHAQSSVVVQGMLRTRRAVSAYWRRWRAAVGERFESGSAVTSEADIRPFMKGSYLVAGTDSLFAKMAIAWMQASTLDGTFQARRRLLSLSLADRAKAFGLLTLVAAVTVLAARVVQGAGLVTAAAWGVVAAIGFGLLRWSGATATAWIARRDRSEGDHADLP